MAAAITDLITQATTSSRPTPTQVTSTRSAAGATLACNALTGWPTATAVHFCTYKINTSGVKIAGSQIDMKGIVSGTNITNITIKAGTDVGNAVGDIVEAAPTAAWANDVVSWGTAQHTQLGAHTGVTTDTLTATGVINASTQGNLQDGSVSLLTVRSENTSDYVASGCVWTGDAYASTRNASMTAGVIYIAGKRVVVTLVTARTFTASKDTYVDIDNTGTITYNEVTNGAASPALSAGRIRVAKIVTGATNIAAASSIVQYGYDAVTTSGQLNYIYNTSPSAASTSILPNSGNAGGTMYYKNQNGIKELWGQSSGVAAGGVGQATWIVNLPAGFFNSILMVNASPISALGNAGGTNSAYVGAGTIATVSALSIVLVVTSGTSTNTPLSWYVRGY